MTTDASTALREAWRAPDLEAVTIDFWDTLVVRTLAPDLVRLEICGRVAELVHASAEDLDALYGDIASALAEASVALGRDHEYRSNVVWRCVLHSLCRSSFDVETVLAAIAAVEVDVNVEYSAVPGSVLDAWRARPDGLLTYVISDNELTAEQLTAIGQRLGLELDRIRVSSLSGRAKRNGALFDEVLEELGLEPKHVVHIGDDELADREAPRQKGMGITRAVIDPPAWKAARAGSIPGYAAVSQEPHDRLVHGLADCIAHFTAVIDEQIVMARPTHVVFAGSEGAYFSRFFQDRGTADVTNYLVSNRGRRDYLAAAVGSDPAWVVTRLLLERVSFERIGHLLVHPQVDSCDSPVDCMKVGTSVVEQVWLSGVLEAPDLPHPASFYDEVRATLIGSLGLEESSAVLVVDVGYRGTAAAALRRMTRSATSAVVLFGDAPHLRTALDSSRWWLEVEREPSAYSVPERDDLRVPKRTLPMETLLGAGPRGVPMGRQLTALRVVVEANIEPSRPLRRARETDAIEDARLWRSLLLAPSPALARAVLSRANPDDLKSSVSVGGERVPFSQAWAEWREGAIASRPAPVRAALRWARTLKGKTRQRRG